MCAGAPRVGALRDERGAVLLEYVFVIPTVLAVFFSLCQISLVYAAKLVVKHSAIAAVRAYAVVAPPNPGDNGSTDDAIVAGQLALGPWYGSGITNADYQFGSAATTEAPNGYFQLDNVTAVATYQCNVPLGRWLACGADATITLGPYNVSYPHQGARYLVCANENDPNCRSD